MLQKFLLIAIVLSFLFSSFTEASKLDTYRNAIMNNRYTIEYEAFSTSICQDLIFDLSGNVYPIYTDDDYPSHKGIFVVDGENSYLETYIYSDDYQGGTGILKKGEDIFRCSYKVQDGEKKYLGSRGFTEKSPKMKAYESDKTIYKKFTRKYELGSKLLTNVFMPIIPPERIISTPQTPNYQFVTAGNLNNGLSFEDFACTKNHIFHAARFYFKGNDLVKIVQASYLKKGGQLKVYNKAVVEIKKFSTTPDQSYLSLTT